MDDIDVLRRDAELLCDDLGERGLMALSLALHRYAHDGLTRRMHAQLGAVRHSEADDIHVLARPGSHSLGEERDTDAHQLTALALLLLLTPKLVVTGHLHGQAHRRLVVAGVVLPPGFVLIRELFGLDEVLQP